MATLTYDAADPNAPELNEAEQEALAVGEEALAQEQALLAGKFKDAEALEQAYIELQKKLGQGNDEEPDEEDEEVRDEDTPAEEVETEEEEGEEEEGGFSDEDVEFIQNLAGGPEEYEEMLKWAAGNMQKDDIEAFDHVIGLNDSRAATFAVIALSNFYKQNVGQEGELLTGGSSKEPVDQFESQAQVVEAMSDPRYDRDPAYRQAVMQKLERSQIQY